MDRYYIGTRNEFLGWFRLHAAELGLPADPNHTFRRSPESTARGLGFWKLWSGCELVGKMSFTLDELDERKMLKREEFEG